MSYTIRVHFERLEAVALGAIIGAHGVYVIWDARARTRPTYIGEGNILDRFVIHVGRRHRPFVRPWRGYVAVLSGRPLQVRRESRAVEKLLLDVAEQIDRSPTLNLHPGSAPDVGWLDRAVVRVAISGYDPLLPPTVASRPRRAVRTIKALVDDEHDDFRVEHDWPRRIART